MSIFNRQETCATCGATMPKGTNFCPTCGAPQGSGSVKCGQCNKSIPASAQFCPYCGQRVAAATPPQMDANRWRKGETDFATRVEVKDLSGFFRRHLIIEPGTRAVLLIDGANRGILSPGKYALDDMMKKLHYTINLGTTQVMTAILIDDGPCELDFELPGLFTTDPLRLGFSCRLVFQLDAEGQATFRFMNSLLKSRRSLSLTDIRAYLFPEIQDAAQSWLGQRSVKALDTDLRLKANLEQHLEMALTATFTRSGLRFESLRTFNFVSEKWNELRGEHEKYFLQLEKLEAQQGEALVGLAELENRKLLFEVFNDTEMQDIFEETQKVAHYEQRAAVWQRMRQAVLSEKMDELRSEDDMEAFLRERDHQKLLSETEWEELKRTLREHAEDHNRVRAHLLALTEMKEKYERRSAELALQREFSAAEFEAKREQIWRELEMEQQLDIRRWEHRVKLMQQEAAVRRSEQRLDDLARLLRELEDARQELELKRQRAKTAAEIRAIEREEDRLDAEMGLALKRQMDADKHVRMEREQLLALQAEEKRLDMQLRAEAERIRMKIEYEQQQADIALTSKQADHEFELNRLDKLAVLSAEALISVSGVAQAELIASLKETEAMSNMDSEAILAMAAEKSPQVAQAFAEKFKAMAAGELGEREAALYERLLAEKDQSTAAVVRSLEESARRESDTARHAMDTTADVAKEFARSGRQSSPTVIYPPAAGGTTVVGGSAPQSGGSGGGDAVICPNCRVRTQTGVQFCANCGHRFFDKGE